MLQDTLRLPAPPQPAVFSTPHDFEANANVNANRHSASAVESWIDGVTNASNTIKPTVGNASQWNPDPEPRVARSAYITTIILRVFSTIFAFSVIVLAAVTLEQEVRATENTLYAALVVCPIIFVWNLAEFTTMAKRQGKGLSAQVHVWVDSVFAVVLSGALGMYIWRLCQLLSFGRGPHRAIIDLIAASALLGLLFIHYFLIFSYWRQRKPLNTMIGKISQWNADPEPHIARSAYITIIILRAISTFLALSVTGLTAQSIEHITETSLYWYVPQETSVVALIVCPLIMLWHLLEFTTMAFRQGKGMPALIHVWLDGMFNFLLTIAFGLYIWRIVCLLERDSLRGVVVDLLGVIALFGLLLVHYFLFFFYWRSGLDTLEKRKRLKPKVMYLPSGEPVVVTPVPRRRPTAQPDLMSVPAPLPAQIPAVQVRPPTQAASRALPQEDLITPVSPSAGRESIHEHFRQGVPPRKPVAGQPVGTHYASPWPGPDYQPDAAERARAAKGERQAQWMTLQGMGLRGEEKSGLGPGIFGQRMNGGSSDEKAQRRLSV